MYINREMGEKVSVIFSDDFDRERIFCFFFWEYILDLWIGR